ncbi:hypothetical protein HanIR_Chr14g0712951 [Helianthus annuus]|nr:hypothetical protein HanIR_Chr14g0712951 [Helianthus annuus]
MLLCPIDTTVRMLNSTNFEGWSSSVDMEQNIQDTAKDKNVKVASMGSFHLCSPLPPSIVCPIMCKPTYESAEEIESYVFGL